jgi:hypothetical protein
MGTSWNYAFLWLFFFMDWLLIAFAMVGGVSTLTGGALLYRRAVLRRQTLTAEGRVTAFVKRPGEYSPSSPEYFYYPQIEFRASDGKQYEFTPLVASERQHPPVGTVLRVRYDPRGPQQAYIDNFTHYWGSPIALIVFGACCIAVSCFAR